MDDNKHMCSLLSAILGAFGCNQIIQSTDPDKAFGLIGDYKPDIVIADLVMRPTDGIEFVRRVRTDPTSPNPFLPIIMVSGHASTARVGMARDAGVNEFMVKPVSVDAMLKRMDAVIRHPRPFIRAKEYFGPDRRRSIKKTFTGREKRDLSVFQIEDGPSMAAG